MILSLGAALLLVEDGDEVGGVALAQLHALLVELTLPHLRQEIALLPGRGALSDVLGVSLSCSVAIQNQPKLDNIMAGTISSFLLENAAPALARS